MAEGVSGVGSTPARSVTYPRDLTEVAKRAEDRDFWSLGTLAPAAAGGIGLGALGGFLARNWTHKDSYGEVLHLRGLGAALGVAAGAAAGAAIGYFLLSTKQNQRQIDHALDFDAIQRPPFPPADSAPTVDVSSVHGEFIPGISGSNIGNVVKLQEKQLSEIITTSHVTQNSGGEPSIIVGQPSGTSSDSTTLVDVVPGYVNAMGLGRVLYDTKGYATMDDALAAYDGNHSVAIVKQEGRYYIADFDAQIWQDISDPSKSMVISDDRVKAILTNFNMYVPSNIGTRDGEQASGGHVFMFAQEQDNETSVPLAVQDVEGRSIGWYDTNGRNRERGPLHGSRLYVTGVATGTAPDGSGYVPLVYTDFQEAAAKIGQLDGQQGLVESGDRYYIVNLDRTKELWDITANDRTAYVLGLRTMPDAGRFALIEDEGGLYAPVGDWWIRAQDATAT